MVSSPIYLSDYVEAQNRTSSQNSVNTSKSIIKNRNSSITGAAPKHNRVSSVDSKKKVRFDGEEQS